MISRGLLISIGITILAVGLVFVYFRNKVAGMEKKVELMFNLIQNYDGQQNAARGGFVADPIRDETYQPVEQTIKSELIQVSEDEDNSDSDEVSDSDEDSDDEEETLKFEPTTIELNDDEVKTINLEEIKHETDEDSLDEIDDDDDDDDEEEIKQESQEIKQESQEESDDEPLEAIEVIQLSANAYKKKTVVELKKIASERGLSNYRSLKKDPLIQLLMSN
jgi:hypothetical protein|tara:strand:+ start:1782 stop:2444 length:663 start_codon:yes stop_codon:yes gene_type:complete